MKVFLIIFSFVISWTSFGQVNPPVTIKTPVSTATEISKVNLITPVDTNSFKVIKTGEIEAPNGASCYATSTLPDGKVMLAWSTIYPNAHGEASLFTPTLTPHSKVVYTKNDAGGMVSFTDQKAVSFVNGNVLIVYFHQCKDDADKMQSKVKYVVINNEGRIVRGPIELDFQPKDDFSLSNLNVTSEDYVSHIYFTEGYNTSGRGYANKNNDTYYVSIDILGNICHPVRKVLSDYNVFATPAVYLARNANGGHFLAYKSRDLFVHSYPYSNYSLEGLSWKQQAIRNVYDLEPIAINSIGNNKAMLFYTDGKTTLNANNRLVCSIADENGVGEMKVVTENQFNQALVKTLSLKDGSIFILNRDRSSASEQFAMFGRVIDKEGNVVKGPFPVITDMAPHADEKLLSMTQLINGQIFILYQGEDKKVMYKVIE